MRSGEEVSICDVIRAFEVSDLGHFRFQNFESGMLSLHGNCFKGKVSATAAAPPPPFITGGEQLWARGLGQLSRACLPRTCKAPSLVPQPPNKQQSKTKHGSSHSTVYGSCPDQGHGSLVDPPGTGLGLPCWAAVETTGALRTLISDMAGTYMSPIIVWIQRDISAQHHVGTQPGST